jgi:hypothetical protein
MNKYIRPVLIGLAAGIAVFALMGWIDGQMHRSLSFRTWFSGIFIGVFTAYLLANLAGNRKVATADEGAKAAALTFTPPAGLASIYVYRDSFIGKAAGMNLSVDDQVVAQLTSPRFTCISVPPGEHKVSAAFGGLAGPQNKGVEVMVTAAAGAAYVFKMSISMGMLQNTIELKAMPDLAAAKTALSRMKMTVPDAAAV